MPVINYADRTSVSTTPTVGSGWNTYAITKPAGVVSGDMVLLLLGAAAGNTTDVSPWAIPAEFTLIGEQLGVAAGRPSVLAAYKIAGGSEPATYSFDYNAHPTTGYSIRCHALRVTGVSATTPVGAFGGAVNESSSSTTYTLPSVAVLADAMLVSHHQLLGSSGASIVPPSGLTSRASSTASPGWAILDQEISADGNSGTKAFTLDPDGRHATGSLFTINGGAGLYSSRDLQNLNRGFGPARAAGLEGDLQ